MPSAKFGTPSWRLKRGVVDKTFPICLSLTFRLGGMFKSEESPVRLDWIGTLLLTAASQMPFRVLIKGRPTTFPPVHFASSPGHFKRGWQWYKQILSTDHDSPLTTNPFQRLQDSSSHQATLYSDLLTSLRELVSAP